MLFPPLTAPVFLWIVQTLICFEKYLISMEIVYNPFRLQDAIPIPWLIER